MIAALRIRPLAADDVETLARLVARAYGSEQNAARLRAYLETERVATFVADLGGEPVGMVVGNDYARVAYVAQMAVEPALQRRGIATALMDELVAWADRRGFPTLELDATPAGQPLYTRYGFREYGQTEVYSTDGGRGGGLAEGVRWFEESDRTGLLAIDADAFGADRADALEPMLGDVGNAVLVSGRAGHIDGYAIAQLRASMLGPVVGLTPAIAAALVDAARSRLPASHRVCIPAETAGARAILMERGYRCARSLAHMVRGVPPRTSRQAIFARMNLGQG